MIKAILIKINKKIIKKIKEENFYMINGVKVIKYPDKKMER